MTGSDHYDDFPYRHQAGMECPECGRRGIHAIRDDRVLWCDVCGVTSATGGEHWSICPGKRDDSPNGLHATQVESDPHDLSLANEYARKWHASEAECARLREALAGMTGGSIERADTLIAVFSERAAIAARVAELETALADILKISEDRERFMIMGPRGWMEAEQIARCALLGKGAGDV